MGNRVAALPPWGSKLERSAICQHEQIANNNTALHSPLPTPCTAFVPLHLCVSFFSIMLLVFFASCATSPKAGPVLENGAPDFSILPAGAVLYLWADVERAKPLLEAFSFEGLSGKDASGILERTDTALAAFYSENLSRRFFLAGWGTYPKFRAGTSMGFSKDWKKVKSDTGNRYWYSAGNNLGIALGSKLAYVSDGDPFAPAGGTSPAPQGFEEFRRTCVLSGWLNEPGDAMNRFISNLGIPIQIPAEDFFFGAVRMAADRAPWELVLKIRTPSANHARSILSLFAFARIFVGRALVPADETGEGSLFISPMEAAAMLFANLPEQDEDFLTLRMGPLGEKQIALLFEMFSVYSNQTD